MLIEELQKYFNFNGTDISVTDGKSLVADSLKSSATDDRIFISETAPDFGDGKGLWIDTSDGNISFWIEDGT